MHKFRISHALFGLAACGLIAMLPNTADAQLTSTCKALVQVKNNLWLVKSDGAVVSQVTNDSQFRSAAALSPAGNLVAFSGKDAPNDVTVIDTSGRLIADVNLQATEAITGLKWLSPNVLRAEEHTGPNSGLFHFVQVGIGNSVSVLATPNAEGSACATSPDTKDTACAIGGAAVELNGQTVYHATDAIASATTMQVIDVAVGTGVATSTSPSFRVDVNGVAEGNVVQLRVTTGDGLWTEQYVPVGVAMDVQFADADTPTRFAVVPSTTSNSGVVRLTIVRSNTGDYSFEGGIAWDPRGKRMAIVEASSSGKRSWVVLNREMGQAATNADGAVDAKEALPIDGPVRSISFTSDTRLRIEGANQVFEKDIPAQGKVPSGSPYSVSAALPQQLMVRAGSANTVAAVKGWSCP